MDLKTYMESGVLELYALNLLNEQETLVVDGLLAEHLELGEELEQIYIALERLALEQAVHPSKKLRNKLLDTIENKQKENSMSLADLPLINRFSDHLVWLKLVEELETLHPAEGQLLAKVLRADDKIKQILLVSKANIPQEVHELERESFLILSGECVCTVGGVERLMKAGDFMEIPLHETHHVNLVSKKVVAILQHVAIAAS